MTATQYLRVFVRFRLLVGATVLAGVIVSLVVAALSGATYTSVARVQVLGANSLAESPSATVLAMQRMHTYKDMAEGTDLMTRLLADHDVDLSVKQLQDRIEISVAPSSTVLTVVVRDSDADRSKQIAAWVSTAVVGVVSEVEDLPNEQRPLLRARVLSDASTPVAANAVPAWSNALLGAAAGVLLGMAAAVAFSRLDRRLYDEDTVELALSAPVLGVLPAPGSTGGRGADREAVVREVRTGILARRPRPDQSLTVMVTAPRPDQRVHQVLGAVAAALADTGADVLFIDADLRTQHATPLLGAGAEESPGLAGYLVGTSTVDEVIWRHPSSGCDVLPAGHYDQDPSDVLHSASLRTLLRDTQQRYDFVLVVAPATSEGTDALAVAPLCDRTLLAVALERTTRPELESALRQLHRVDAEVMGALVFS